MSRRAKGFGQCWSRLYRARRRLRRYLFGGVAFAALYLAFMGRTNGPRAGWLLASLEPDFVISRLEEASR